MPRQGSRCTTGFYDFPAEHWKQLRRLRAKMPICGPANTSLRPRSRSQWQRSRATAKGHRDATMTLVAFRHGLRAELVDLQWSQMDFPASRLHVRRVKQGTPATHPLAGAELRALRRLRREAPQSEFVFLSERGAPFSTAGFAKMVERAGVEPGLKFGVHPHMLRHACGYTLANAGHDTRSLQAYLGHKSIQHTVRDGAPTSPGHSSAFGSTVPCPSLQQRVKRP
jgi:integrase